MRSIFSAFYLYLIKLVELNGWTVQFRNAFFLFIQSSGVSFIQIRPERWRCGIINPTAAGFRWIYSAWYAKDICRMRYALPCIDFRKVAHSDRICCLKYGYKWSLCHALILEHPIFVNLEQQQMKNGLASSNTPHLDWSKAVFGYAGSGCADGLSFDK